MWGLTSDRPAVYLVWTQSAPPAPTASISKHERWDEAPRPIQAPQAQRSRTQRSRSCRCESGWPHAAKSSGYAWLMTMHSDRRIRRWS
jgi:hypothetical protein